MDRAPQRHLDVHAGIEDALSLLANKINNNIQVKRQYAEKLPLLKVQGSELNQVWTNLIDNAIEAMQDNGILTISTRHKDSFLVVEIADNGKGIPEEIQSRIFEPFFTTKDTGHTGLSLDVVHRIISGHYNGRIDLIQNPVQRFLKFTSRL